MWRCDGGTVPWRVTLRRWSITDWSRSCKMAIKEVRRAILYHMPFAYGRAKHSSRKPCLLHIPIVRCSGSMSGHCPPGALPSPPVGTLRTAAQIKPPGVRDRWEVVRVPFLDHQSRIAGSYTCRVSLATAHAPFRHSFSVRTRRRPNGSYLNSLRHALVTVTLVNWSKSS